MINTASIFSQLLKVISRTEFYKLVHEYKAEFRSKGFSCWSQLTAMLFCHLAEASSLREICNGLACSTGKMIHLGLIKQPSHSTLSYANANRPAELYEKFFFTTIDRFRFQKLIYSRKKKFRFKNKLMSLDSTTISLCLSLFPWATYRRAKGGVKLHVMLDHDDYMPQYVYISDARKHDRKYANFFSAPKGSIIAMDRGYNDYSLFYLWTKAGLFFVTRMKTNAQYEVVSERKIPQNRNVLSDQDIRLVGNAAKDCEEMPLRRVVIWDAKNNCEIELLTNHMNFGSTTISSIYKDRWEIELFFKELKQHLKVKTFIGTTENALRIQIWTALLALLLLRWMHHLSKAKWSFSILSFMTRQNLFTYRHLLDWINNPFEVPPHEPDGPAFEQLTLDFGQHKLRTGGNLV